MGPITTPRALRKSVGQVEDTVAKGAKIILGESKAFPNSMYKDGSGAGKGVSGYFMAPAILTGLNQDMILSHEEMFAPVCSLLPTGSSSSKPRKK